MQAALKQYFAHPGEGRDPGVFGLLSRACGDQKKAWDPAFAGMIGLWGAPAFAHDEEHHGLPGALHSVSADHSGWILLGAVVLLGLFALRKPILKALKVRSRT
ncbi:MAG: hypothetical protein K9G59_13555 [Caulobacter sp.]|nr:hypothetical protein [Caulobacter sp.]